MATFFETITAAINDFAAHGYDSQDRLDYWTHEIQASAADNLVSEEALAEQLRRVLGAAYDRLVGRGAVLQRHQGVSKFTVEWIKPKLRAELDRRIMAAANLIRLNRDQTIADTLRRFQGWATSIPAGGARAVERGEVKNNVRKEIASLPFRERRVLITTAHQLNSSISQILADEAGAIAAKWRSHASELNYDFRPEHRDRDSRFIGDDFVFLVRGSWAHRQGYVKVGRAGFTDEVTAPGFEPFCRCYWAWQYALSRVPQDMLTEKGKEAVVLANMRHHVA